jgi:ketosteroid isomerase-like protein
METTPLHGREGARKFWRTYRDSFEEIHSDFSKIVESDDAAMLEWTSKGRLRGDRPIDYSGVSVLELRDGKVRRFRTYFDARPFEQGATRAD